MNSKWNPSRRLVVGSITLALSAGPAFSHLPLPPKKGETGRPAAETAVANFSLVDQRGERFDFGGARGKIVAVTFLYTGCPDVCPLLAAKFAAIQGALERRRLDDVLLLSVTTDPERDSAAALKAYSDLFKADYPRWRFLTGSPSELAKVWKQFGVRVERSGDGEIRHTSLTSLIDREGIRRVDYYGEQWEAGEILRDIAALRSRLQP